KGAGEKIWFGTVRKLVRLRAEPATYLLPQRFRAVAHGLLGHRFSMRSAPPIITRRGGSGVGARGGLVLLVSVLGCTVRAFLPFSLAAATAELNFSKTPSVFLAGGVCDPNSGV